MIRRNSGRGTRTRVDVNCADCPSGPRCWSGPLDSGADVIVQRQDALPKGTSLLRQGEAFSAVHILVHGCLILREAMADGTERVIDFLLPGDLVGVEGWARGDYPYTAEALAATAVCRVAWPAASGAGAASRFLLERLLAKTAGRLDRCSRPWCGLPAVERVAAFVTDFAHRAGFTDSRARCVEFPMTRAQLGSYLGLTEETVVRALGQLRRQGRIEIRGRALLLPPPQI